MTLSPQQLAIFDLGGPQILLVLVFILIFFGGDKLPELARGLGKTIREFKKATAGVEEELKRAIEAAPEPAKQQPSAAPKPPEPTPAPSATQGNPFLAQPPPPDKPAGT